MLNWIHRLFNPHCEKCDYYDDKIKVCKSCETLTIQLESVNALLRDLTKSIIEKDKPSNIINQSNEPPKPILPRHRPWKQIKEELEANDRLQAKILHDKKIEMDESKPLHPVILNGVETVEELEKELDITNV